MQEEGVSFGLGEAGQEAGREGRGGEGRPLSNHFFSLSSKTLIAISLDPLAGAGEGEGEEKEKL